MAKRQGPQAQADWMNPEDQAWLGHWARKWATDPANGFCDPSKPSVFDRQLLSLFDSIEACASDIDAKIEGLHQTWKHENFLTKSMHRYKVPYLLRGVAAGVASHMHSHQTDSARQTLLNWNRISCIVNAQNGEDWQVAKEWVGPVGGPSSVEMPEVEKPALGREPRWGDPGVKFFRGPGKPTQPEELDEVGVEGQLTPPASQKEKSGWKGMGGGMYMGSDGTILGGPSADLVANVSNAWRNRRAKAAPAVAPVSPEHTEMGHDEGVVTDA